MSHAATALLARPFVEQATATRANVREMLTRVVDELKHQLIDYPWMQDAVSQYAIQKLNGVQEHLLYPPFVEDKMVLEQIYRQVPDLTGQTPLADWFRARSAIMLKRWKALSGKGLSPLWDIHYTEPSVTYLHDSNELGAFHDATGALRFWWERGTYTKLEWIERCFGRRYAASSYSTEGRGTQPQEVRDVLLDRVALQVAHTVYAERSKRRPGPRLAALPSASAEQLFFLAFATGQCSGNRPRPHLR
ncbi:uncharacterized protein LOC121047597 [Ixodes scapularis]|uniref:uncharacterized protein LOC121047597 n=1 Tax=Ixodes scapularis TaxID=6945 RepID=UPI001C3879DD|nr:uncharacterized protein LOC121047597 [Ixodes scapularis]